MQQSEQEYIRTLKERLGGYVSREDLDDILSDYAEHFSIGRSEGRSEEDLCRSLGSPDDVAKEIRATYLVKKAEQARSAENIWHAVMATLGLGLFNLAVVLIPFILLIVFLVIIFMVGLVMLISGPILLLVAVLQLTGFAIPVSLWSSPLKGILISIGLSIAGVVLVMLDFTLVRTFYRIAIRYLKWNIRVIRGGEAPGGEGPAPRTTTVARDGATALDLQVRLGAGEITLGAGADDLTLLHLTAGDGVSIPPYDFSSILRNTTRTVGIRSRHSWSGSWCADQSVNTLDVRLNREVPVSLDLSNRAGRTRLDLGELSLSFLKIRNGAGETRIDLAGYHGGNFDATIKNGIGSLVVRMPKESNLRVQIHRGMGDVDVRGFQVDGDTYLTRTDRPGAPQISCRIRQGIGSIRLEAV